MADLTFEIITPLVHGGGQDGSNTQLFRRQSRVFNGEVVRVPQVSGNALRGILRRHGSWALWEALGEPTLTPDQARVLSSGGALRAEKAPPLEALRAVRECVAHVGLFGAAWGGKIHEGSLVVGHLMPECLELGTGTIPAARLVDIVMMTRHDTTPIPVEQVDDDETNQMIYEVEALCSGTILRSSLSFRPWATEAHKDWAAVAFQRWLQSGAHLGGKSAIGHGRVKPIEVPEELSAERAVRALAWVADHRADVLAAVEALA